MEPADIADDVKADLSREPEDAVDALADTHQIQSESGVYLVEDG